MVMKSTNGKGSKRRPENNDSYRDNYEQIFKKKGTTIGALYHPGTEHGKYESDHTGQMHIRSTTGNTRDK